ncbi:hypothetical protein BGP82_28915 [Pseudomonas putida]|uniref:Thiamine pyrophosphate enzyme N-terminal TPP-binding domain-containing protein n=1 Tax=Pseudomonas putida TaxID=303 RepID=A0A2S3WJL9_PSEPU|nr:hypothetical protein BGP82_28915 [Pseudomonas putida]
MAKAADVVVQCLENEGVEYVFGIPGEENLDLLESLRKSKIKLVLTRHEQSAGYCPVDYSENDRILNSELRERALAV